jgi:hypothetical protein
MPTRRAFLLAGTTFAVGSVLGGACGYSLAASATKDTGTEDGDLAPSGDVELDELRRLAVKAPIEELVQRRLTFINILTKVYPRDRIGWQGIGRLADEALSSRPFEDRRTFSRWLAQVIEGGDPSLTTELRSRIAALRSQK